MEATQAQSGVADILNKAADLIEPEGAWVKDSYYRYNADGGMCFCALGAILQAQGDPNGDEDEDGVCGAFAKHVTGQAKPYLVARWNDAPERTQAEVVAALREAALKATA